MLSVSNRAEMAEDLARFTHDPLGYVLWCFPWGEPGSELEHEKGPRTWQRDVLAEIGRLAATGKETGEAIQEAVSSGHGIGKSALVAWCTRWALATHEDARGVITANTEGQLRGKTWPEMAKWHRLATDKELFVFTATALHSADVEHEKTWRVDAVPWSENNTEAFAGLHNLGKRIIVIFDEASGISDKVWEVTEGALTDVGTEIIWLVFGNPTVAEGRFRECFRERHHRWKTRQIDSRTVDGTNKLQFQKWVEDHGEDSDFVKVRVRGMFPSQSNDSLIEWDKVLAAKERKLTADRYHHAPKILGVDVARFGDDETVICMRQGPLVYPVWAFRGIDSMQTTAHVARLIREHQPDAVFIDDTGGFGSGVVDRLTELGHVVHGINFASQPMNTQAYRNKRAEMWDSTREWLEGEVVLPDDPELLKQLPSTNKKYHSDGTLQLESKDDMKKRGMSSPDRADALALTFALPVAHRHHGRANGPRLAQTAYDWRHHGR